MATRDKGDAEGFLSRWSQRKRAAEQAPEETPAHPRAESAAPPPGREPGGSGRPEEQAEIDPATLPDIETLEAGSDFSAFMKKGVPEALQRRALRRLWHVDPFFKEICMLDDYNLDYTDAATVVPNLKTIYQIGRGMSLPEEDAGTAADAAQTAQGGEASEPPAGQSAAAEQGAADSAEATAGSGGTEVDDASTVENAPAADVRRGGPGERPVLGTATRRAGATGPRTRSALRRRWGDGSG